MKIILPLFVCIAMSLPAQPMVKIGLSHEAPVRHLSKNDDGTLVASSSEDGTVKVFESATGRELATLLGHTDHVTGSVFAPDGLVTVSRDGSAVFWDLDTFRQKWTHRGADPSFAVALSPDRRIIAAADFDKIHILEASTGKRLNTVSAHDYWIRSLVFSPDGRTLFSASEDETVAAWDTSTWQRRVRWTGYGSAVLGLAISSDGVFLGAITSGKFSIRSVANGSEVYSNSNLGGAPVGLGWDANRNKFILGLENGRFVNVTASGGNPEALRTPALDGLSAALLLGTNGIAAGRQNGDVALVKLEQEELGSWGSRVSAIDHLSLSGNGKKAASASLDGVLRVWDLESLSAPAAFRSAGGSAWAVALNQDGTKLAGGSNDGSVEIWNVATGQRIQLFKAHDGRVNGLDFSSDGSKLASSGNDGLVRVWDVASGRMIYNLRGHMGPPLWVQFSRDDRQLFSSDVHNLAFSWNMANGSISTRIQGYNYGITAVVPSPDMSVFITSSVDQAGSQKPNVHVYDARRGTLLITFPGHSGGATGAAFSSDGKYAATVGRDRRVRIWDIAGRREVTALEGHQDRVTGVDFLPGDQRVITSSADGTLRIWDWRQNEWNASLLGLDGNQWLAWTPQGYFAGTDSAAKSSIYLVDRRRTLEIDQVFEALYRPDIVELRLLGRPLPANISIPRLSELLQVSSAPPEVAILSPLSGTSSNRDVLLRFRVTDKGGGIGRIVVFNGETPVVLSDGAGRGLTVVPSSPAAREFEALLTLRSGENTLGVVAYNRADTVAGRRSEVRLGFGASDSVKPKLHVLTVAVQNYRDRALRLTYTVPDAVALGRALEQTGGRLYESVQVRNLHDEGVTKDGFSQIFDELASDIGPDDVFVLFFAGHGVVNESDGEYYFLPVNFRYNGTASIVQQGISKAVIQENLVKIRAQKVILLFDTCHSGAFLSGPAARGLAEKTAVDRLMRAVGRAMLTASTDQQVALEGYEGHGIFTYALLQALGGGGDADRNGYVTIKELALFVESSVPDWSFNKWGYEQVPQSLLPQQDFPFFGNQ